MTRMIALFSSVAAAAAAKGRPRSNPGTPSPPPPAPPPGVATTWDYLYPDFTVDTGVTAVSSIPSQAKPARETSSLTNLVADVARGVYVHRVTAASEAPLNGSGVASYYLRHEYSRRQSYNYDSTLRIAQSTPGFWFLYDAVTNQKLDAGGSSTPPEGAGSIIGLVGDCEPFWSPSLEDKDILYHSGRGGGLVWYRRNARTGAVVETRDFTSRVRAISGFANATHLSFNGEGRPSDDMRYWGWAVEQYVGNDPVNLGFICYDWQEDTFGPPLLNPSGHRPNWVGTSSLGNYVLLGFYVDPCAASIAAEEALPLSQATGTRAYTRDFSSFKTMTVLGEHSDAALDAYGNEGVLMVSFHGAGDGVVDGHVFFRRCSDGVAYDLGLSAYNTPDNGDTGTHLSGLLSTRRPGLGVVGRHNLAGGNPHDAQVCVVEIVPESVTDRRIYRLGFTHSTGGDYWFEPHPSPNWDGTRIIFASNWGSAAGAGQGEDYEMVLPSTAFRVPGLIAVSRTAAPTITGTATQGGTLTRTLGTYTGFPVPTITGIWQVSTNSGSSWADVAGETGSTFVIPGGAANGTQYRWGNEVATQAGGGSTTAVNSNVATVAVLSAPVNTAAPTVPATSSDAAVTTATAGTYTGNPVPTIEWKWQRNIASTWTDSGLTGISATLSTVGEWRVAERATNSQGTSAWVYSGSCTVSTVPTFRQATPSSAGALTTAALGESTPAGRTLIVAVVQTYGANPPRTITSVQDSVDGVNFTLSHSVVPGSGNIRVDVYHRTVTNAGTRSATVVLSGAGTASVVLLEYSGITTKGAVGGANGTSTTAAPGSVNEAGQALYLNVVGTTTSYHAVTPDATFTQRAELESGGPTINVSEYVGTGPRNPATTIAESSEWAAALVTFI